MFIINIAEFVKDISIFMYLFTSFGFYCIFLLIRKLVFNR